MKSTAERLSEAMGTLDDGSNVKYYKIPQEYYDDLVHDRIVPWRLIEDGFAHVSTTPPPNAPSDAKLYSYNGCVFVAMSGGSVWVMYYTDEMKGTRTYTDLLNLIRLIG